MHSDHDPIQIYIHSSVYPVCIHDRQYQEIGSQPCDIRDILKTVGSYAPIGNTQELHKMSISSFASG